MSTDYEYTSPEEREAEYELEETSFILGYQFYAIVMLIPTMLIMGVTEWWNPDFFNFPYWQATSWEKIENFWPLLIYGGCMATLGAITLDSSKHDHALFTIGTVTSVLAGLWEEFGFRFMFVCTSMLSILIVNWLLSVGLGVVIGGGIIVCGIAAIATCSEQNGLMGVSLRIGGGLILMCIGIFCGWFFFTEDFLFTFYDWIVVPVVNFVTISYFEHIFYGEYPRLFIFGMIAANAAFRDGHKYQGPIGILNSWIIGFVMMHATLTYGLWTAVAIHVLYDLEFDFVRYVVRRLNRAVQHNLVEDTR